MPDVEIDKLQIEIGASASSAERQLDRLTASILGTGKALKRLGSNTGYVNQFANSLARLSNINLNNTVNNLERLCSLDFDRLKDVKLTFNIDGISQAEREMNAVQKTLDTFDISGYAKKINEMYRMTGNAAKKTESIISDMVKSFSTGGNAYMEKFNLGSHIAESGSIDLSDFDERVANSTQIYRDFVDVVNKTRFHLSKTALADFRSQFDKGGLIGAGLGNLFTGKAGTGIEIAVDELRDRFPEVFSGIAHGINETDIANELIEAYTRAKDIAEPQITPINILETGEIKQNVADTVFKDSDNIGGDIAAAVKNEIWKNLEGSANKIPLTIDIDEERIVSQIQRAVNNATKKTYTSKPIEIEVNTSLLKKNIETAISNIELGKLPAFTQLFSDLSKAITAMNTTKLNDTGITNLVGAIKRLSEADMYLFDFGKFNTIADALKSFSGLADVSTTFVKLADALKRLSSVNMENFDTAKFQSISDALKSFSGLEGASETFVKLTNALNRLAGTDLTKLDTTKLKDLFTGIQSFGTAGTVSEDIIKLTNALKNLVRAGSSGTDVKKNLKELTDGLLDFFTVMANAPAISDSTVRMAESLATLAASGGKAGKAAASIKNTMTQSATASNNFASTISRAFGSSVQSTMKGFSNILKSIGKTGVSGMKSLMQQFNLLPGAVQKTNALTQSVKTLLATVIGFRGITGAFNWLKEATTSGSSIVELENVIDKAFGSMNDIAGRADKNFKDLSGAVYNWARTTIDNFGVSEIAARKYAGVFMSIFNTSGFDKSDQMHQKAAEMSMRLTEIAGDIASFYDTDIDQAFTKLKAGLAGSVRPLRDLGINMTVANLESFALSQGIDASWQSLSQSEQMLLRYNYILEATKFAQGDFANTSGTFANQVRLLTLNFEVLSTTIGQGFVSALAPAIRVLNTFIRYLITGAQAFRTFMFTLFGKPVGAAKAMAVDMSDLTDSLDGSASGADDLSDGAGSAADGLSDASDSAKKLKKNLAVLPFDELNQLSKKNDSTTSTTGTGTGGTGTGGSGILNGLNGGLDLDDYYDWGSLLEESTLPDGVNKWAQRLKDAFLNHDWKGLGGEIAWGINTGFEKIYDVIKWENVGPKVVPAIEAFTTTINSMVDKIHWYDIGKTFGAGIDTLSKAYNHLMYGIKWENIGKGIAKAIHGIADEVDWHSVGKSLVAGLSAAWEMFYGFTIELDPVKVGNSIKRTLEGAFDGLNAEHIGTALGTFATKIGETLSAMFEDGTLENSMTDWLSSLIKGFTDAFDGKKLGKGISDAVSGVFGAIKTALFNNKKQLLEDFNGLFTSLPWGEIAPLLATVIVAKLVPSLAKALIAKKAGETILTSLAAGTAASTAAGAAGTAAAGTAASTAAGMSAAGALGLVGGIFGLSVAAGFNESAQETHKKVQDRKTNTAQNSIYAVQNPTKAQEKRLETQQKNALKQMEKMSPGISNRLTGDRSNNPSLSAYDKQLKSTAKTADGTKNAVSSALKGIFTATDTFMKGATSITGSYADNTQKDIIAAGRNVSNGMSGIRRTLSQPLATIKIKEDPGNKTVLKPYQELTSKTVTATTAGAVAKSFTSTRSTYDRFVSNTATKTASGTVAGAFNTTKATFDRFKGNTATKTASGVVSGLFNSTKSAFDRFVSNTATKTAAGSTANSFYNTRGTYYAFGNDSATKTTYGKTGNSFYTTKTTFGTIYDKNSWVDLYGWQDRSIRSAQNTFWDFYNRTVTVTIEGVYDGINTVYGWVAGVFHRFVSIGWNAEGGLFTKPTVLQGFGEAGAEAALPLTNRRVMSRIAESITQSGGYATGLTKQDIADTVLAAINAANDGNDGVTRVYSTIVMPNGDTLAKVVSEGEKANNKRYSPVGV